MNALVKSTGRLLIAGLLYYIPATHAHANPLDADGYIMNWTGVVKPEYNSVVLPLPVPTLAADLASSTSSASLCAAVEAAMSSLSEIKQFDSCTFPTSELRGKMIGPNTLGLKIIFVGINIQFEVTGAAGDNPKINLTGNVEVDAGINFAGTIDGSVTSTNPAFSALPMTVVSTSVQFSNINTTTQNVVGNILSSLSAAFGGPSLGTLGSTIAQQGGQYGGGLTAKLNSAVSAQNGPLHTDALTLGGLIRAGFPPPAPAEPSANNFFLLGVTIDASQSFVVNFQRNGVPAVTPVNCFVQSLSYATVTASCYSYQSNGTVSFDVIDPMYMNRLDPAASTPSMPVWDLADDGVSNSWDVRPPRFSVPFFEDTIFQTYPSPPATATYEFCAFNVWGGGCGPQLTVKLDLKVAPVVAPGPPACGPNSHPYRQCQAVQLNPSAYGLDATAVLGAAK